MRWLLTSDLHQMANKWKLLVEAVKIEKPVWVFIAGDILPKDPFTLASQRDFFKHIQRYLDKMQTLGVAEVFTYLGNDDLHLNEKEFLRLEEWGYCRNMNQQVHLVDGRVIAGMNKVRDYPFGYKHYCHPDGPHVVSPTQLTKPVTINPQGDWVPIHDLREYLESKKPLGVLLDDLATKVGRNMDGSVWMIHQPPSLCGMDIIGSGEQVGSPTVQTFIERTQPLLTMHGHIHESPYMPNGQWHKRVGRTHVIQPGQLGKVLHYVMAEVSDGKVYQLEWHNSRDVQPEVLRF